MKVAPVLKVLDRSHEISCLLVHTGQHYDAKMSEVFFQDLEIREPDAYLGVGSGSHAQQTARVMEEFEKWCLQHKPDRVVVAGDVNSTMAAAIVAVKLNIPSAHIESGLRSFDREMPEEINRIVTDQLCEILFITSEDARENLIKENVQGEIHFVGNPMIDSLVTISEKLDHKILSELNINSQNYLLVTLHRPRNVDNQENLQKLVDILLDISKNLPVVFPVHPRTEKNLEKFDLSEKLSRKQGILLTGPIGYRDFICLEKNAKAVLTDSGGIQEETTYFGIPCLTARPNTERPVTITMGTNELVNLDKDMILDNIDLILKEKYKKGKIPPRWDGKAGERIAQILIDW
ncbi:MAG: UDP-N-acetylglucosamine 2-epimerase [Desulfuromonas sp. SDB]|nr:MAG: UDP-N-acetylglucosamine 2-epimerase [Desulfuromonas sp. SDB]